MDARKYLNSIKSVTKTMPKMSQKDMLRELRKMRSAKTRRTKIKIRNKIILSNYWLIPFFAKYEKSVYLSKTDLYGYGLQGLIRAIEKHDGKSRFSVYAGIWIKQAIKRAIKEKERQIRIPVYLKDRMTKYYKARKALEPKYKNDVPDGMIATKLKWPIKEVRKIKKLDNTRFISLTTPCVTSEGSWGYFSDSLEDTKTKTDKNEINAKVIIKEALKCLSKKEKMVITLYLKLGISNKTNYGIFTEIGKMKEFLCTRQRIEQIKKEAVRKMQLYLAYKEELEEMRRERIGKRRII